MKKTEKRLSDIESRLTKLENPNKTLEFEDHNFRINSEGWIKKTDEESGQDYLVNPKGDITELINCEDLECNGEQLFTFKAMLRETKKAGKRVPTDEEFSKLLETKEDMPNLVFTGLRFTNGTFYYRGTNTYFWSSSESGTAAWRRHLGASYSSVDRHTNLKSHGFSVRCLKNY